jgi:hypothetical protein
VGLSSTERALKLIELAHPEFRDELTEAAEQLHLVRVHAVADANQDRKTGLTTISDRCGIRAFLDRSVSLTRVEGTLGIASRAPSENNSQPWRVYVAHLSTSACSWRL